MTEMGVKKAKTMKIGSYEKQDEALYIWFCQQRERNVPVTGPIFMEKARALFTLLYPEPERCFTGSTGFQWRFCK